MPIQTNLFLYFIILCVGASIGALVERFISRRSAPPRALPPVDKNRIAREGDVEVLSAWRTSDNKVWLEMDGKRLDDKEAMQAEHRQRLVGLVLDLRPWLEIARPAAAAPAIPLQPVPPADPLPGPTTQPVQSAVSAPSTPAQPVPLAKKKPFPAVEEVKPGPVLDTIIQQIDKVLQAKLETSPLRDRDIGLAEGPGGIVIVRDGANRYEGLDAIPDPEVTKIIRQAVSDWEKGAR